MSPGLSPPPALPLNRSALFFDVDGTLVAIEKEPEAVVVSDALRALLERLIRATGGALALVSGRSIEQLDRLFTPLAFSASGLHGLERRLLPAGVARTYEATEALEAARAELARFAEGHAGTLFEDKGLTLALHYRMAAEHREKARALVQKLVNSHPDDLVLLEGKMVFELKPPGFDKGRAIADFMEQPPFQGRCPIFAGDDVTDEAGFMTIKEMQGVAIKVGADERPTEAGYGVADVDAMLAWLDRLPEHAGEGA
ncbi:MAG: trehalose-phosphatase [Alphaproteobacteria bacterium]